MLCTASSRRGGVWMIFRTVIAFPLPMTIRNGSCIPALHAMTYCNSMGRVFISSTDVTVSYEYISFACSGSSFEEKEKRERDNFRSSAILLCYLPLLWACANAFL